MSYHYKNERRVNEMTGAINIEGQDYKIGFNGLVYVMRNSDWVRSFNYTAGQVQAFIKDSLVSKVKRK